MGAGYHGGFGKTKGRQELMSRKFNVLPIGGCSFNEYNSKSVKNVEFYTKSNNVHNAPMNYAPNSVFIRCKGGKYYSERYYDDNGNAYLDIDYSDHGNPKMHPVIPHEHKIVVIGGKFYRDKKRREMVK